MSNIYLIRHGFTPANNASYNHQKGLSKIAIDSEMPLDLHYGVPQAEELGLFLNTIPGKTLILVSPYERTRETLDLALIHMYGEYDIYVCDDLHEIDAGIHYAKTKKEILDECPEAISYYRDKEKDYLNARFIGGESHNDVKKRVQDISKMIERVSDSNVYDNIFVFAHGGVNQWIYYWLTEDKFPYQRNCEVIPANGSMQGKSIFVPKTYAPKGYKVDIREYPTKGLIK